ncbi:hypothetical protein SAMN05444411_11164 [Lutibacter oricola]|uniref:Uncharacterized protein n=1 Tax=Lutibacter oricola TaxID=762486 RepID=A0A1H3FIB2_9FLAO|nr:hypothetical protein [Lutibacter oricola]SDX90670.1 hypothetical protein SAMN05444411_11164 [Lutibacter oricola]
MKKILLILAITIVSFACKTEQKKEIENTTTKEVVETPTIALGEFDSKAGDYINKEIKVNGIVDHVCKHGGKKILLVTDNGDAHVFSEERFDEALKGSEITVTGVVLEDRIDEAYLLKLEEDNIKSHSEGKSNEEQFKNKKNHIAEYRAKMKKDSVDHISNYSIQYISHKEIK